MRRVKGYKYNLNTNTLTLCMVRINTGLSYFMQTSSRGSGGFYNECNDMYDKTEHGNSNLIKIEDFLNLLTDLRLKAVVRRSKVFSVFL